MPGFPEGKVPLEVSAFHNKLEMLNGKLQNYKGNVVDSLISEQAKSPQPFNHFHHTPQPPTQLHSGQYASSNSHSNSYRHALTYDQPLNQTYDGSQHNYTSNAYAPKRTGSDNYRGNKKLQLPQYNKMYYDNIADSFRTPQFETKYLKNEETSFQGRSIGKQTLDSTKVHRGKTQSKLQPLPKHQRLNPYIDPPEITEKLMKNGLMSLMERGYIPKDVDVTPAFERGCPTLNSKRMKIEDSKDQVRVYKRKTDIPQNNLQLNNSVNNANPGQNYPNKTKALVLWEKPTAERLQQSPMSKQNLRFDQIQFDNTIPSQATIHTQHSIDQGAIIQVFDPRSQSMVQSMDFNQLNSKGSEHMSMDKFDYDSHNNNNTNNNNKENSKSKRKDIIISNNLNQVEYTLLFKNFKIFEDGEYVKFKKAHMQKWGNIAYLIRRLEKCLIQLREDYVVYGDQYSWMQGNFDLDMVKVDGEMLAALSRNELIQPKESDLLNCIKGRDQKYVYQQAAIKIQAAIRSYLVCKVYKKTKQLIYFSNKIKNKYKLWKYYRQTMTTCEKIYQEKLRNWRVLQQNFKAKWNEIKDDHRIEVHIPSLSLSDVQRNSMEKFIYRQNLQLSRIYKCRDPKIKVIYLLPYDLSEEVFSYYWKIFELEDINKDQHRVSFFVPNHADKFPATFSLSTVLYYSDQTIKKIKRLCEGRNAYIVPGNTSHIDQKLAVKLNLPIYCGDPNKNMMYSTKSGSKRIFNIAEIPIPPSAFDIYDEIEFYTTLTRLVATNIFVNRWLFKIDNEFRGRGTAYFDTHSIKVIEEMRKKKVDYSEAYIDKLYEAIKRFVPKRTLFSVNSLYSTFDEFLMDYVRIGGIIEASPNSPVVGNPSYSFNIEPDGNITLINSYDKILHSPYVSGSTIITQDVLTDLNIKSMIDAVGDSLYKRDIFGYVTVDFVAFKDPNNLESHPLFWAIDLDLHLTDSSCIHTFYEFLLDGHIDANATSYILSSETRTEGSDHEKVVYHDKRYMMYIPYIYSKGLTYIQYKTFFHMCRLENISYDLETKLGSIFLLSDSLQGGSIGLICIGKTKKECLKYICVALNFIQTQTSSKQEVLYSIERIDKLQFRDLSSTIKMLYKKLK